MPKIKRSILESFTSGLRSAADPQEMREAPQKFVNKVKDVKTDNEISVKEMVETCGENMRKARHLEYS